METLLRVNVTRSDRITSNGLGAVLDRQASCQSFNTALGAGVEGVSGDGRVGMHRRNIDDRARFVCLESLADERTRHEPDCAQIDVIEPIEVRFVGLVRKTA